MHAMRNAWLMHEVQVKTRALDVFLMPMHTELLGVNGYWAFGGDDNEYWALTCADGYWAF
jgi:hypothetical protein